MDKVSYTTLSRLYYSGRITWEEFQRLISWHLVGV